MSTQALSLGVPALVAAVAAQEDVDVSHTMHAHYAQQLVKAKGVAKEAERVACL